LPKRKFGIWPPLISLGFFGSEKSNLHRFKYSEFSSDSDVTDEFNLKMPDAALVPKVFDIALR
jgi:hypothetical protein